MIRIITESFKKYIGENDLIALNQILTSKKLDVSDIKNAFAIATSLKKYSDIGWYWDNIIKEFSQFCSNDQIINKSGFSQLLSNINSEFQRVINSEKERNNDGLDLLVRKIFTIISVGTENVDLKDNEYFALLNRILASNVYWQNYDFIRELFKNGIMKNYPVKRGVALDVALNQKVDVMTMNSNLYPNIWSILTNLDVLSMDNDTYKKAIEIAIVNIQAYVLDVAMKQDNLTPDKKKVVIDYYFEILPNYLQKYYCATIEQVKEHVKSNIFNVVYSDRLASMDIETYTSTLEEIKKCNKPLSYTKVLASDTINEEQRNIALEMIKQGEVRKHEDYPMYDYKSYDYKSLVALAAISPILATFPTDKYKKMLSLVDSYCQKAEEVYHAEDNFYKWSLISNYGRGITKLLNNYTLFSQNIPRLLMAIGKITFADNRNQIEDITSFCDNENSAYYTDDEYRRVLELIKNEKDGKAYLLVSLFTNKNVPFMEDKTSLFAIAISGDETAIKTKIEELNSQGQYNMNMYRIFNDVDEDTIRQICGEPTDAVKKLVRPYIPKQH